MLVRIRWQIGIAGIGCMLVLALVGTLVRSTTATAYPAGERTYVEGVVGVPRQLNPLLQTSASSRAERDLAVLLFEGLTRAGADGTPEPALAERWTTDETGMVWTFTLRPDLRWHDGEPFTSADVVFTVQSVQDARFPGDPALAAFWRAIAVDAPDAYRVRFTLAQPYPAFVSATTLPILPRHLLESATPAEWSSVSFNSAPVGTGPFRLQSLDEREARLRPFEGATRGRPALDLFVVRFYDSAADTRAALARRDIDGYAEVATTAPIPQPSAFDTRRTLPLAEYTLLEWNTREAPLDNRRLREALVRGLDRTALVERALGGHGLVIDTPLLPQTPYGGDARLPSTDAAMAGRILDDLGWTRTESSPRTNGGAALTLPLLVVDTADNRALAAEVARQWGELGIDVPVEAVSPDGFAERIGRRSFALALRSWMPSPDPDLYALWHSSQADTGANIGGLADPQLDRLIEDGRTTLDADHRTEVYRVLGERWAALLPALPLYQSVVVYDLARDITPTDLEATRLLATPAARWDGITAWTFPAR